jgi:putative glutamine amidotransferase
MSKQDKPIIGITFDHQPGGGYSLFPWYALRENYFKTVEEAGGVPVGIPYCHELIPTYLNMIDGLLVPGGDHDIDPSVYGDNWCHDSVTINHHRFDFDSAIMKAALEMQLPVLGICAGQQLINVIHGGTLIQHIPDAVVTPFNHQASHAPHEPMHTVKIIKDTLLYEIVGVEELWVNSTHHQAVKELGHNLILNALAPDGIIEGIEATNQRFCLGVEWHPEHGTTESDRVIIKRFIHEAART